MFVGNNNNLCFKNVGGDSCTYSLCLLADWHKRGIGWWDRRWSGGASFAEHGCFLKLDRVTCLVGANSGVLKFDLQLSVVLLSVRKLHLEFMHGVACCDNELFVVFAGGHVIAVLLVDQVNNFILPSASEIFGCITVPCRFCVFQATLVFNVGSCVSSWAWLHILNVESNIFGGFTALSLDNPFLSHDWSWDWDDLLWNLGD